MQNILIYKIPPKNYFNSYFSQKAETWAAENRRHLQHTVNVLWPVGWRNLGSVKKLAMKRREKVRDKSWREKRWETYRCFTSCRQINTAGLDNNAQSWKKRVDRTGTKNKELMIKRWRKETKLMRHTHVHKQIDLKSDLTRTTRYLQLSKKVWENCYCSSLCHCPTFVWLTFVQLFSSASGMSGIF